MKSIIIVDYGVGNLQSVKKAFARFGALARVSDSPKEIENADALVLPGVGSFEAGMRGLRSRGLVEIVQRFAASGRPILGICLGAQILLSRGYEFGEFEGLGIIPGKVVRFPSTVNEKIPQVGWNTVREGRRQFDVYFVHSYILVPDKKTDVFGVTVYGGMEFCSVVKRGKIIGVQFHPEKSGKAGLQIIENFIRNL